MLARVLLAASLGLSLLSCGDDHDLPEECAAIVEACHDVDTGAGMIHTCHESAEEDWSREECVAMSSACLAACSAQ
jgi:hypothetical protein